MSALTLSVVALLALIVVCSSGDADKRKVQLQHQEHVRRVRNFKCTKPMPNEITFADLNSELLKSLSISSVIIPQTTVLQRCWYAGCCVRPRSVCVEDDYQMVDIPFKIKNTVGKKDTRIIYITARNHTTCRCGNN